MTYPRPDNGAHVKVSCLGWGWGEETKIKSKYTAHKHKYKYMIVLQKHSCFQISHRYPLLPSCLPWPNLTQHERDRKPPTILEEEMGSLLIGLKRKLPRTLILNSVDNKLLGNMFQSSGSLGESCLDQDWELSLTSVQPSSLHSRGGLRRTPIPW